MTKSEKEKLEAKLKRMFEINKQNEKEKLHMNFIPIGTKVIRRRRGSIDRHIF